MTDLSLATFERRCLAMGMAPSGDREWTGAFVNGGNTPHNPSDAVGASTLTVVAKWMPPASQPDITEFGEREWYVEVSDSCRFGGETLKRLHYLELILIGGADHLLDEVRNTLPFLGAV